MLDVQELSVDYSQTRTLTLTLSLALTLTLAQNQLGQTFTLHLVIQLFAAFVQGHFVAWCEYASLSVDLLPGCQTRGLQMLTAGRGGRASPKV